MLAINNNRSPGFYPGLRRQFVSGSFFNCCLLICNAPFLSDVNNSVAQPVLPVPLGPVFGGSAALQLFKHMGEVGRRSESDRLPDFGNRIPRTSQQFLGALTADMVMIGQGGAAGLLPENPQQVTAVHKQVPGHLLQ